MRIGIAQTNIKFEDREFNIKKAAELIRQAKMNNAELVVFPEMSFTGFSMNTLATKESDSATLNFLKKAAVENKIAVAAGWVCAYGDKAQNHYSIVDENGIVISDYIKIHPFSLSGEDSLFIAGSSVSNIIFKNRHLCTFICYDLRFPELFSSIANDADIIVVAANWPASRESHWKALLTARAIENQCYVVGVNCVGSQKQLHYSGGSCVINPVGAYLYYAGETECLSIVDLPDDVGTYRAQFPFIKDRRVDLYKKLL
jgi:omega-amidase